LEDKKPTRRGFLELILGGSVLATLGAIFYPVIKYIIPPPTAEAMLSQLKLPFKRDEIEADPKKAKYFKYGQHLGIIFVTETGALKALDASCTHLGCTVQNRPDLGIIWCACHNGKYSYDGSNISGPPPRPLVKYQVNEVNETIFVTRSEA
jgi:cytochrome b6-f complex iron-sulfur subunit